MDQLLNLTSLLCFFVAYTVFSLPLPNDITSNELPISIGGINSAESDEPIPVDIDIQFKQPKVLCDLNWRGPKCQDYATADQIIMLNKIYDQSSFKEFDIKLTAEEQVIYSKKQSADGRSRQRRSSINTREWPKFSDGNVYIPYNMSNDLGSEEKAGLLKAIEEFNDKTCIRMVNATDEYDRINIINDYGCWSYIGRIGGAQDISLGYGCYHTGTAIHEIMHALGFHHEQSRRDRDRFIKIHWDNIPEDWHRQFEKDDYGQAFVMGQGYDVGSVMHYGNKAVAIDDTKDSITSIINPSTKLGQRKGFSPRDLREINLKYRCEKYL